MKIKQNKNITYGTVELPDDEFDPKNVKFRVTTFIDLDVVDELRRRAKGSKTKYQTLLNQILRDSVFGKEKGGVIETTEEQIRRVIREELKRALK